MYGLFEIHHHSGHFRYCIIYTGTAAGLVSTDIDQIFRLLIGGQRLSETTRQIQMVLRCHIIHDPAGACQNINWGIDVTCRQTA